MTDLGAMAIAAAMVLSSALIRDGFRCMSKTLSHFTETYRRAHQ